MPNEHNFRSAYYKALFAATEKKAAGETDGSSSFWKRALEDEVVDTRKLAWCALRFGVPALYRPVVWKVLFGILPPQRATWEFVTKQRQEQFGDTVKAFAALLGEPGLTMPVSAELIARMCVLQNPLPEQRAYDKPNIASADFMPHVVSIASAFLALAGSDCDAYFMTSAFLRESGLCKPTFSLTAVVYPQINSFSALLATYDNELFQHLVSINTQNDAFAFRWFASCFAQSLAQDCVECLWDKIIAANLQFTTFASLAILSLNRRRLLQCKSAAAVCEILENLSDLNAEFFAAKTLEIRDKHLGPATEASMTLRYT